MQLSLRRQGQDQVATEQEVARQAKHDAGRRAAQHGLHVRGVQDDAAQGFGGDDARAAATLQAKRHGAVNAIRRLDQQRGVGAPGGGGKPGGHQLAQSIDPPGKEVLQHARLLS